MFGGESSFSILRMMRTGVAAILGVFACAYHAQGQSVQTQDDAVFLTLHVDIKGMKSDTRLALFPWEIYSASLKKMLGIDLFAEDEIDLQIAYGPEDQTVAAIATTNSAQIMISDLAKGRFFVVKNPDGGTRKDVRRISDSDWVIQKADRVWYIGSQKALADYSWAHRMPMHSTDKDEKESAFCTLKLFLAPIRDEIISWTFLDDLWKQEIQLFTLNLFQCLEQIELHLIAGRPLTLKVVCKVKESVEVAEVVGLIQSIQMVWLEELGSAISRRKNSYRLSQREQFAWDAFYNRLTHMVMETTPKVEDKQIVYELDELVVTPLMAVIGSGVLETTEMSRLSNERFASQYKFREIYGAISEYFETKGAFPLREILSDQGESLLSWRVALLPHLGYESLYKKFHLNEPWDSPHNIKLLEEMPSIYRSARQNIPPGYTTFVAPYGVIDQKRKTVWDVVPTNVFADDSKNLDCLLLVEVEPQGAVPWSSPEDVNVMQTDLRTLLRSPPEGNGYLNIDGETDFLSNSISSLDLIQLLRYSLESER